MPDRISDLILASCDQSHQEGCMLITQMVQPDTPHEEILLLAETLFNLSYSPTWGARNKGPGAMKRLMSFLDDSENIAFVERAFELDKEEEKASALTVIVPGLPDSEAISKYTVPRAFSQITSDRWKNALVSCDLDTILADLDIADAIIALVDRFRVDFTPDQIEELRILGMTSCSLDSIVSGSSAKMIATLAPSFNNSQMWELAKHLILQGPRWDDLLHEFSSANPGLAHDLGFHTDYLLLTLWGELQEVLDSESMPLHQLTPFFTAFIRVLQQRQCVDCLILRKLAEGAIFGKNQFFYEHEDGGELQDSPGDPQDPGFIEVNFQDRASAVGLMGQLVRLYPVKSVKIELIGHISEAFLTDDSPEVMVACLTTLGDIPDWLGYKVCPQSIPQQGQREKARSFRYRVGPALDNALSSGEPTLQIAALKVILDLGLENYLPEVRQLSVETEDPTFTQLAMKLAHNLGP